MRSRLHWSRPLHRPRRGPAAGFVAGEKALLVCVALAVIIAAGALLRGGSESASNDAARVLSEHQLRDPTRLGVVGAIGSLSQLPTPAPDKDGKPGQRRQSIADWAKDAHQRQDRRFFDSTTKDWRDKLKHWNGYSKCNQFVSSAFRDGGGMSNYPQVDGRDPVVDELADPNRFTGELTFNQDPSKARVGDMVLWYDKDKHVHHSAILSGYDEHGNPLVTYAGAEEVIKQIPLDEATSRLKGVPPVFRGRR